MHLYLNGIWRRKNEIRMENMALDNCSCFISFIDFSWIDPSFTKKALIGKSLFKEWIALVVL